MSKEIEEIFNKRWDCKNFADFLSKQEFETLKEDVLNQIKELSAEVEKRIDEVEWCRKQMELKSAEVERLKELEDLLKIERNNNNQDRPF